MSEPVGQEPPRTAALRARLRTGVVVVGVIGGMLGVLASLVPLEVSDVGGVFGLIDGRTGTVVGLVTLLMALICVAGGVAGLRSPALASTLLYIGGCGGFLACGGTWLIPGVITLIAANVALWAISNPYDYAQPVRRPGSTPSSG
jgi:hypothetical protein